MTSAATRHESTPGLSLVLPAEVVVAPLRVSSQAKMTALIQFALKHLSDSANAPLAIHSFAPAATVASSSRPTTSTPVLATALAPEPDSTTPATVPTGVPSSSSAVLPKLVSVVEIIKRSFAQPPVAMHAPDCLRLDTPDGNGKGKGREVETLAGPASASGSQLAVDSTRRAVAGLHQYTRLGALEELGLAGPAVEGDTLDGTEEKRQATVALNWIESGGGGTKRPKRTHTPYMVIVLSTTPVPSLAESGFTYQPPSARPKNASNRLVDSTDRCGEGQPKKKKRKRKQKKATEAGVEAGVTLMDDSGI